MTNEDLEMQQILNKFQALKNENSWAYEKLESDCLRSSKPIQEQSRETKVDGQIAQVQPD